MQLRTAQMKFPSMNVGAEVKERNWNSPAKKCQVIYDKCFAGQVGVRRYTRANFMRHYLVSHEICLSCVCAEGTTPFSAAWQRLK